MTNKYLEKIAKASPKGPNSHASSMHNFVDDQEAGRAVQRRAGRLDAAKELKGKKMKGKVGAAVGAVGAAAALTGAAMAMKKKKKDD